MTKKQAVAALKKIMAESGDSKRDHIEADNVLLKLIGDKDIEDLFHSIHKWYA